MNVNAYNGGLQLEVDCLTSAGGLLPASNSLLYSTFASGAYPVTAVGWTLNVHESVTSDGSGTLLYYDDCRNVRRVYQTETPPENRYAVTRYTSQTGPDYIDYTPATKRAVFNDGYGNTKTIVDGYLHSFSDGSGNTVEYTYEGVEPKSVRLYNTSAGLSVNLFSFTYYSTGSNANLQKIQNLETNESVEFLYDSTAMRLDKIIFRKGTVETDWIAFGYTNGRITTVNDRASSAFDNPLTVQYDSSGRVTALSRPNGAQTSFAYGNDDAKNRLTKISSSYSSYEDTYQVFSTSGCTKSVYSAKRSAAPPVALSTSAVVFDDSGKVLHQGATSFPDNDYNALVNYTCSSQSGWGFVNAAYASYNGSQVIKITGDTGKLNFAHQGVSTSNFKGISSGGHFMVSGWVRSSSSLKTVDTEAYVNTGGASFGMSCVVTYTDGLKQDVRVNADPNNTDWQYVSLLVRPDAAKTISGIAVYLQLRLQQRHSLFRQPFAQSRRGGKLHLQRPERRHPRGYALRQHRQQLRFKRLSALQSIGQRPRTVGHIQRQPRHPDDAPELQQRQPENKLYIRRLRQRQGNEAVQPVAQPGHHRKVCVFQRPLCNGLL